MRAGRKTGLIAALAAAAVLVVGVGYAMAQTTTSGQSGQQAQKVRGGQAGPGRGKHLLGGEVIKVEDSTITVKTLKGDEKSVKVDDQTKYRKPPNSTATLADVTVGEKVGIMLGKVTDGEDPITKTVIIGEPKGDKGADRPKPVVGEVTAVNGDTVTIKTADGDKQVKLPAITTGMRLGVVSGADGAVRGVQYNPPQRPQANAATTGDVPPPDGSSA